MGPNRFTPIHLQRWYSHNTRLPQEEEVGGQNGFYRARFRGFPQLGLTHVRPYTRYRRGEPAPENENIRGLEPAAYANIHMRNLQLQGHRNIDRAIINPGVRGIQRFVGRRGMRPFVGNAINAEFNVDNVAEVPVVNDDMFLEEPEEANYDQFVGNIIHPPYINPADIPLPMDEEERFDDYQVNEPPVDWEPMFDDGFSGQIHTDDGGFIEELDLPEIEEARSNALVVSRPATPKRLRLEDSPAGVADLNSITRMVRSNVLRASDADVRRRLNATRAQKRGYLASSTDLVVAPQPSRKRMHALPFVGNKRFHGDLSQINQSEGEIMDMFREDHRLPPEVLRLTNGPQLLAIEDIPREVAPNVRFTLGPPPILKLSTRGRGKRIKNSTRNENYIY